MPSLNTRLRTAFKTMYQLRSRRMNLGPYGHLKDGKPGPNGTPRLAGKRQSGHSLVGSLYRTR